MATRTLIKKQGDWELSKIVTLKYFKKGRANMHTETTYCVECVDAEGTPMIGKPNVYWLKSKRVAEKHLKIVTDKNLDALQRCNAIDSLYNKVVGE